jgi:AcrR family transcriptional regulator
MARPRSDIRARLVAAARGRFLENGVDGASLREIARDAKTNIGMVVYYFPTKDDLFLAVVEEVYAGFLADLQKSLTEPPTTREKMRGALLRLGTCSEHELEVIRLMLREALLSSSRFQRLVARFMRGHVPMFIAMLLEGVAKGELDDAIPLPLLAMSVVGLGPLPQMIRRAALHVPAVAATLPDAAGLANQSLDLLFRAVGPRQPIANIAPPVKRPPTKKKPARKRR